MQKTDAAISSTTSLCPSCLTRVPGHYEAVDDSVELVRTCPDHGTARREVWGSLDHWEWANDYAPETTADADLTVENDHACLAVIEVTQECNLSCSFCFASSGPGGRQLAFDEVTHLLDVVIESGGPRPIQFSGGEPTIRDDLPELIETAVEKGFEHIQVNTNGIVLAHHDGYAEQLRSAGVSAVYLQFDGLEPSTYEAIRDVDISAEKQEAIQACREADLPVVLVPTIVPGTNDHELGDIIEFALANHDVVQSVNFQPVAHFGRYADHSGRYPIDETARAIADQLPTMDPRDFLPVPCCSSYCQLATAVLPNNEGEPEAVTQFIDDGAFDALAGFVDEADWMELLAGTSQGVDRACSAAGCCGLDLPTDAGGLFEEVLPVSITGFMDADAADVDRLGNCCISVPTPDGELVPFCAYNMTTTDGRYALRNRNGWGGRDTVTGNGHEPPETAKRTGQTKNTISEPTRSFECSGDGCCGG